MKRKDWLMIAVVAIVSGVFSVLLSGLLFSTEEVRSQKVEVVPEISAELRDADDRYFNQDSFNPARNVQIGRDPNATPFD